MAAITRSRQKLPNPSDAVAAEPPSVRFAETPAQPADSGPGTKSGKTRKAEGKKKVAIGTTIAKQLMKGGKRGQGQGDLRLEDLDEAVLKRKLETLETELADYKAKCERHKKENDWYREEIEACQRDTAEYISYLESKKSEKQSAIDQLIESSKLDLESFVAKKKAKEVENEAKMEDLRKQILDLEDKIDTKQQEVQSLSDVMSRRARHESDIAHLHKEMQEADHQHQIRVAELERTLLEERIKVQKETDAKIKEMESAAHEKAHKYLTTHISALDAENQRLSTQLRALITRTQDLLDQKHNLETQNIQLLRDSTVRQDMLNIRLQKVVQSEKRRERGRDKRKDLEKLERKRAMEKVVRMAAEREKMTERAGTRGVSAGAVLRTPSAGRPGEIAELIFTTEAKGKEGAIASLTIKDEDLDWSDAEDDEYL
ncbi:hypothetical protein SpCBS45565_g03819 [Spizellomyces sp. 'palustris']|nr:hypothetical protein SpCBS45565_g03819 [Spizellomyces sp. 'palustris']